MNPPTPPRSPGERLQLVARGLADGLASAFGLLTAIPVPGGGPRSGQAGGPPVLPFFPVVGLVVGALQAVAWKVGSATGPAGMAALATLASGWWLTRGLHWDGWLDTCDALFVSHRTREERLAILRDSRAGAFAVLGGVGMAMAQWVFLLQLPRPATGIILAAVLSRWAMALAAAAFPVARPQGMAAWLRQTTTPSQALSACALAAAAAWALAGRTGLGLMVVLALLTGAFCLYARRLLGGLTGDVYGAVQVLTETGALWLLAAFSGSPGSGQACVRAG